jgi:hydrogenase/urease accessory protein HupE
MALPARPIVFALAVLMCLPGLPAGAHFLLNLNVRILHVEHLAEGLRVYLRTPMPYLVADRVGPVGRDGLPEPAPYTTNRLEDGKPAHYIDPAPLGRDPKGLGRFAAEGFRLAVAGEALAARVEQVRAHPVGRQPPFATLVEAKSAFADAAAYPADTAPAYVGDVVVDIVLHYEAGGPVYDYDLSSTLDPGLPGQEDTANLILDYGPGDTKVFRARGLLADPIAISRSLWAAVLTFVKEGVRHILEGLDHVLFVLCLTLGAASLRSLVWRATGFTIGHSVTLSLGFFGYVPRGVWFIPAVETGIALSILYAAAIAVLARHDKNRSETVTFLVTAAMGLLHGLGFSFVLQEILKVDSPDIWQSLLAFNLGVEVGQLLIILFAWPLFRLVARFSEAAWRAGRWSVAAGCAAVAFFWTAQRGAAVLASL